MTSLRSTLVRLEDWMEDDSMFIWFAKIALVIGTPLVLGVALLVWATSTPADQRITLDSAEWTCTASHRETYYTAPIMAGKAIIPGHPVTQTTCDQWTHR